MTAPSRRVDGDQSRHNVRMAGELSRSVGRSVDAGPGGGGNQGAVRALALDILCRGLGSRLATNVQYQESLEVGSGTVQKALQWLARAGVVALQARGHQGTYITDLDFGGLWRVAGLGELWISMTQPGAVEAHGLAQGLAEEAHRLGVPLVFEYVRGAQERTNRVLKGNATAVVLSCGAATSIGVSSRHRSLDVLDLGPHTYYAQSSVVVIAPRGAQRPPERIAIDRASYDHEQLTLAEFPPEDGYHYVECDFPGVPAAVLEGLADAGIWHRLSLLIPMRLLGLETALPHRPATLRTVKQLSNAQVLWRADRPEVAAFFRLVRIDVLRARQRKLLKLEPDSPELRAQLWLA